MKAETEPIKQVIDRVEKKLDHAQEDIAEILIHLDYEHSTREKRVEKIEEHLGLPHS